MNSSAPAPDRAYSSLAYIMPLASALDASEPFGELMRENAFSIWQAFKATPLLDPLRFLIAIENSIFGLAIFIVLFVFVIRNQNISRFIRFNVLQSILVSFMISITLLVLELLGLMQNATIGAVLSNVLFLGGMAIVVYGVGQSVMGRYAEIPTISDAVNMQMPY